jgi:hypothetical protein
LGTTLTCFSLGDTVEPSRGVSPRLLRADGRRYGRHDRRERARSSDAIAGPVEAYAAVGVDELILDPTVADPDQSDADGDGQAPTTASSVRL